MVGRRNTGDDELKTEQTPRSGRFQQAAQDVIQINREALEVLEDK